MLNEEDRRLTIEVSYPDSELRGDMDMLEVYFKGPKSGGGVAKEVDWIRIIKPGKCYIKFASLESLSIYISLLSSN